MVSDVLKEIFKDEWNEKERQMQEKESRMQEKESRMQEMKSQIQQKESQIHERELLLKKKEESNEKREQRLNLLIRHLLHDNLIGDLKVTSEDNAYLEQMYQRYGL